MSEEQDIADVVRRGRRISATMAHDIARDVAGFIAERTEMDRRLEREAEERHSEHWAEQKRRRAPEVDAAFQRWVSYLGSGTSVPIFERVRRAVRDVRQQRQDRNVRGGDYEAEDLAVRVTLTTAADEIGAAAGQEQDPFTVAWVLAGLRCRVRPFCSGCTACQTVTAPTRPAREPARSWL